MKKFSFGKFIKPAPDAPENPCSAEGNLALPVVTNTAAAAVAASAAIPADIVATTTATNNTGSGKMKFSMKADPLRYRPRPEASSNPADELKVAERVDAGIIELARRLVSAFFPHFLACQQLLAGLKESDGVRNLPRWEKIEQQLQFGELRTLQNFVGAVRSVFASADVAPDVENEFETELHVGILQGQGHLLAPAVRAALELKEISDAELFGLAQEERERVQRAAVAVDGEAVRLFWRKASYAARRRVRAVLKEIKAEQLEAQQAQKRKQEELLRAQATAQRTRDAARERERLLFEAEQQQQRTKAAAAAATAQARPPSSTASSGKTAGKRIGPAPAAPITDFRTAASLPAASGTLTAKTQQHHHSVAGIKPQQHHHHHQTTSIDAAGPDIDQDILFGMGPSLLDVVGSSSTVQSDAEQRNKQQQHMLQQQQQLKQNHPERMPANPHTLANAFQFDAHDEDDGDDDGGLHFMPIVDDD